VGCFLLVYITNVAIMFISINVAGYKIVISEYSDKANNVNVPEKANRAYMANVSE